NVVFILRIVLRKMEKIIRSKHENTFEWIDVINPSAEELNTLAEKYNLHPAAVKDSLQPEHLPKYEIIDDTHFIICRYYDIDSHENSDNVQELSRKIAIFFNKDYLITIHRKEYKEYTEVIEKYKDYNVLDLTCKIIKSALATYEEPVVKLDRDIDYYESRI